MELAATTLGRRFQVADIITGGLVLAVVTSLPNAVSAVYVARRGRGGAVLSTALNSNAINVLAGLLIPAALTGLGPRSGQDLLAAGWYTAIAACDAASGPYLILIGLLIAGPCCALRSARWAPTATAGCYALALGAVLGIPDQIFATTTQYAFLAAVAVTSITATVGAALLQRQRA